jgi:hypothetical protein
MVAGMMVGGDHPVKALASLHTALGEHNDRVVMDRLIRTVLETNPSANAHLAAGFVLGQRCSSRR